MVLFYRTLLQGGNSMEPASRPVLPLHDCPPAKRTYDLMPAEFTERKLRGH